MKEKILMSLGSGWRSQNAGVCEHKMKIVENEAWDMTCKMDSREPHQKA